MSAVQTGVYTGSQGTVISLFKDTHCKDLLDVRTPQLLNNDCILTAVAPVSEDNTVQGHILVGDQSMRCNEKSLYVCV